ncbi:DUF6444 domain-containing protein [Streptomyces sp. NPDC127051]|uniref:DUF6444 domain-containing protein n=1 Tax=Streptomyces sp. NPDC127051 TaxID=3347119 RepID=UPI00365DB2C3
MSLGLESASREDLLVLAGLLQRQNEELAAANERVAARVAELERRLGRNSGNSSMPPSSDAFGRPERNRGPRAVAGGGVNPVPADRGWPWPRSPMSPRIMSRLLVPAAGTR